MLFILSGIFTALRYHPNTQKYVNPICHEIHYLSIDDLPYIVNSPHGSFELDFLEERQREISYAGNDSTLVSMFYSVTSFGDGFLIFLMV